MNISYSNNVNITKFWALSFLNMRKEGKKKNNTTIENNPRCQYVRENLALFILRGHQKLYLITHKLSNHEITIPCWKFYIIYTF